MRIGGECDIDGCNLRHIYGSTLCFKHTRILREEGHKVMSPEEVPWWEEGGVATEGGEEGVVRCDDDPSLHYGLCEFDTRDGICWHCKNMVHPDIHLIHLICNRRFGRRLLQPYGILGPGGEDLDPELLEALDRILEPLEMRDVASHSSLPPQERVKALKKMDDREHILSELRAQFPDWRERGLDQFDFDPNGVGLGYSISRLYDDIHAFNQEEWGPEWAIEWGLGGDPVGLESSPVVGGETEMHPVGYIVGAGYLWYVLQFVIESDGELLGLLASDIGIAIALAPIWLINKIFQRRIDDVEEESPEEPPPNISEAGTHSSLARKQLTATTIAMAIGFLLPWGMNAWGDTFSGLEDLRWAPSGLSFWLFDAPDLYYGISTTVWFGMVIRSALPLIFLLALASTWYMHIRGNDSFSRTASRIHFYLFAIWYVVAFMEWGEVLPTEYDIGLYITAISGIGLDTTPDGIMSKYIRRGGQ